MQHRLNFLTAVVMLILAGTLVFVVTRDEALPEGQEAYAPEKSPRDWGTEMKRPRVASRAARPHGVPGRPEVVQGLTQAEGRILRAGQLRSDLRIQIDQASPQQGDLELRAQRVESFALRRLGALTEQLELTAEQQARIFPILARGAQSYDPRMRIVTGDYAKPQERPAGEPVDKSQELALLDQELNPVQSDELAEQAIQDLLIWEEIIDGLAHQLDQATPGQVDEAPAQAPQAETPAEDVTAPAADPVAPPESHGGRNIFGP